MYTKRLHRFLFWAILGFLMCGLQAQAQTLPQFGHVVVVPLENHSYSEVVGSSSMPYLNSLIARYGLATNYTANTHPSIGNYFMLTTGQILTNDDGQTPSSFPVGVPNIASLLEAAGKTWKDYPEMTGTYIVRHDPLQYFTNVNTANLSDFSQFAPDLANHALPNFSWITPNGCDDAHDCGLSTADSWLQTHIDPLVKSSYLQTGGDGLLIIVFDEDDGSEGNRVACVIVSPKIVSAGFQSSNSYHHQNALRLMAQALGLTTFPGAAASAANMSEFFGTGSSGSVSLSPSTAAFGNQTVNTTSTARTLTLTNGTSSSVTGISIALAGTNPADFAQTHTCGTSLTAGANCTISVTFTPTTTGSRTATLTTGITGVSAALSGSGVTSGGGGAGVTVSPNPLNFGSQAVGTTSSTLTSILTNSSSTALTITAPFGLTGDYAFAGAGNCPAVGGSVPAGGSCSITLDFTPTATGTRTGAVTISYSGPSGSPLALNLTGTGLAKHGHKH
jgi:hypothetical protein